MSKATRQRSARERLAEERKRQSDRRKKTRALLVAVGALAAIAIAVIVVVVLRSGGGEPADPVATAPLTRQADGSMVMARPGVTAPTLEIYEDFQCPACKKFEEETGRTIQELAAAGELRVVFRPFSLFRQWPEPTKGNSTRALNASLCAPADKWLAYHDRLFAQQGRENAPGFGNADLIKWAREVGITGDAFVSCVTGNGQAAQAAKLNEGAQRAGVQSTPWVTLNGTKLGDDAIFSAEGLRKAVRDAGGKG
jgi:protein-disulfide isomerase